MLGNMKTKWDTCQLTFFLPPELFMNKIYDVESKFEHDKFYLNNTGSRESVSWQV